MVSRLILLTLMSMSNSEPLSILEEVKRFTVKSSALVKMSKSGIVSISTNEPCQVVFFRPPLHKKEYFPIQTGKYLPFITENSEFVALSRGKHPGTEFTFYNTSADVTKVVHIPGSAGEPDIKGSNFIYFPYTRILVKNGILSVIPQFKGSKVCVYRNISSDGQVLASWVDDTNPDKVIGRFAIYTEGKWVSPPLPIGFKQAIGEGMSNLGFGIVKLSQESPRDSLELALNGEESFPQEVVRLETQDRFFKNGIYFGSTPPKLNLGNHYPIQTTTAYEKYSKFEFYTTIAPIVNSRDVPWLSIPRFRVGQKWLLLQEIIKGSNKKSLQGFSVSWHNENYFLLYDNLSYQQNKPTTYVLMKINPLFR